jgi:predicted nucleic-acid-binding Zn-ribbon protein
MREERTCPRCGHAQFFRLHAMPEQVGSGVPGELAPTVKERVGNGRFETLLCRGCGHTRWFAREVKPDPELEPVQSHCVECDGHQFWRVRTLRERAYDGMPVALAVVHPKGAPKGSGHYELKLCQGCGATRWYAHVAHPVSLGVVPMIDGRTCAACGGRHFLRVDDAKEEGDTGPTPLRLLLRDGILFYRALGTFDVVYCRDCALAEWYAQGWERLREDKKLGISLVEATAGTRPAAGPYR